MGERPMWKPKHRLAAADRSGLRYPSDLIDAEWAIIEPMIPPAKHGGRKRHDRCARDFERHFLRCRRAANGRRCPRTCHLRARYGPISIYGPGMVRWSAFITRFMWRYASRR